MATASLPTAPPGALPRAVGLLLNVAHAVDHMFLLIFATAVAAIAADFGYASWQDLMPFSIGAFALFGLGALPSGRLGDLWGRRAMMLVFFFGIGASALLTALTQDAWQLAAALTLLGAFASIYHPVGIPMLVRHAANPGMVIGVNGLAGNLGIAVAALVTGFLVKWVGWRAAFAIPGLVAIGCGIAFARIAPREATPPARRAPRQLELSPATVAQVLLALTLTSTTASLIFNFTTNGNAELLAARMRAVTADPALLGVLLAMVYVVASFAQLAVGRAIDRYPLRGLFLAIVAMQVPLFLLASGAQGWLLYGVAIAFMAFVFGAIPFTDAIIVRYVDDRARSRVAGLRLTVSFGVSSLAVWLLGPFVKSAGFDALFATMAGIAVVTLLGVALLPRPHERSAVAPAPAEGGRGRVPPA